jgi:hypothetical protein
MRSYTVFQFTRHSIENRSACHSWDACRRLPTPALRCLRVPPGVRVPQVEYHCCRMFHHNCSSLAKIMVWLPTQCSDSSVLSVGWAPCHTSPSGGLWSGFVIKIQLGLRASLTSQLCPSCTLYEMYTWYVAVNSFCFSCGLKGRGVAVRVPVGGKIFLLSTSSRPVLGPTQPPIQWVSKLFPPG